MQIHSSIHDFTQNVANNEAFTGSVVTTGTFDGVHLGHQKILQMLREEANLQHLPSVVITFNPHPRTILFKPGLEIKLLNSMEEKIKIIEKSGIDHLIIEPFTLEFSKTTFIYYIRDLLIAKLGMKTLVVGYDHHFGKNREGSIENIRDLETTFDFSAIEVPAYQINNLQISSTKIRNALLEGEIENANHYLGYPYSVTGKVIHGDKIGRTLGYPTANIEISDPFKLVPADGIYAVIVNYDN